MAVVRGSVRSPRDPFRYLRVLLAAPTRAMHLYLGENPRTLYLATTQQDEKLGRPQRVLVFRVAPSNPSQAIVEFLQKDQVDLSSAVLLTNRTVKGCMGLISVGEGKSTVLANTPLSTNIYPACMKRSLLRWSLLLQKSETLVLRQAPRNQSLGFMRSVSTA